MTPGRILVWASSQLVVALTEVGDAWNGGSLVTDDDERWVLDMLDECLSSRIQV